MAAWLSKARIEKGWSVPELAFHSEVTAPAIYRIEAAITRNLRETTRKKLEHALSTKVPEDTANEVAAEAEVVGLGALEDFDPHIDIEVQFLHAHSKQTLKDVVNLLRAASIPCAAIADMDLLNSRSDIIGLLESFGRSPAPDEYVCLRDQVAGAVEGRPENEILSALLVAIAELKAQLAGGEHTLSGARSALRRIDSSSTKWAGIKRGGLHALEEPVKSEAQSLIRLLKEAGIFVVPVGELESWIDVGTRRKKEWIVLALKSLATVGSPKGVADFIGDVIKYVRNPSQRTSGIDH